MQQGEMLLALALALAIPPLACLLVRASSVLLAKQAGVKILCLHRDALTPHRTRGRATLLFIIVFIFIIRDVLILLIRVLHKVLDELGVVKFLHVEAECPEEHNLGEPSHHNLVEGPT